MNKDYKEIQKLKLKEINKENSSLFTKINCPSCEKEVPAENLQLNDKIGKCNHCNVVFPFHDNIANLLIHESPKEEVSKPEGIDVVHFQNELDFTIEQPYPVLNAIGLFTFLFFGFLFTMVYFKKGGDFLLFFSGFLFLAGIWNLYPILTRSKNKIYLNIDRHNLTVKWRPKKMIKDTTFDVQEIDQVYLKIIDGVNYSLYVILNGIDGQKHIPLLHNIGTSLAKARYLEQEIEKHLGIKDRKVSESNVTI